MSALVVAFAGGFVKFATVTIIAITVVWIIDLIWRDGDDG